MWEKKCQDINAALHLVSANMTGKQQAQLDNILTILYKLFFSFIPSLQSYTMTSQQCDLSVATLMQEQQQNGYIRHTKL